MTIKLDWLKNQPFTIKWNLRSVYKITEWKNGCIYRTRSVGYIICLSDYKFLNDSATLNSVSTSITRQLG